MLRRTKNRRANTKTALVQPSTATIRRDRKRYCTCGVSSDLLGTPRDVEMHSGECWYRMLVVCPWLRNARRMK